MAIFDDPLHDEFGSWILGFAPYGGGDVGEVEYLGTQVKAGDDDSFFDAFLVLGEEPHRRSRRGGRSRPHPHRPRQLLPARRRLHRGRVPPAVRHTLPRSKAVSSHRTPKNTKQPRPRGACKLLTAPLRNAANLVLHSTYRRPPAHPHGRPGRGGRRKSGLQQPRPMCYLSGRKRTSCR